MRRIFRVWTRNRVGREVDEEVESHLRMRAEALEREGLSPEEARREAERRFGELGRARRTLVRGARRRDAGLRLGDRASDLRRDVVLAVRRALRRPASTALELTIFALGVGLTTATFTLVDRVLLRPLPLPEPDRLVSLESADSTGSTFPRVSASNWYDWRDGAHTLVSSGLYEPDALPVGTDAGAVNVTGQYVAGEFFQTVRMPLVWGRVPTPAEMASGEAGVVLSLGLWDQVVGGPPAPGHSVRVSGQPREVVGVVRPGGEYLPGTRVWLPARPTRGTGAMRNNINWYAVGRVRPGTSLDDVRDDLSAVARRIRESDPEAVYSYGVGAAPLRDFVVGGSARWLWVLLGAAAFVLLTACVNLAALHMGRGAAEWQENAVRRALGAGRARIVQQQATRHVLTAAVGGGLGVAGARLATAAGIRAAGVPLPRMTELSLDGRVAAFGVVVSLLAGLLAGLVPALRASTASLRAGAAAGGGDRRTRSTAAILVGLEVALAAVLVTGAGLLVRDLRAVLNRGLGFDPAGVVTAHTTLTEPDYRSDPERRLSYWLQVRDAVRAVPGVESAAVASSVPAGIRGNGFIEVEGRPASPAGGAAYQTVGEDYFRTLSIRLLAGRTFGPQDTRGSERVVVVNRAMAERYWPDDALSEGGTRSALGKRVRALSMESIAPGGAPWLTVIGVVDDVRHHGFLSDPAPEMYVDFRQAPLYWTGSLSVVARVRSGGTAARTAVHDAILRVDPRLAVEADLLPDELAGLLAEQRLTTAVLTTFGILATLLAALGVYGLVSLMVGLRTREMGIRTALGARGPELLGLILGAVLRIAALAVPMGLGATWMLRAALRPVLEDVSATDPGAYGAGAVLLVVVTALAAFVPARRALRLDPVSALRDTRA